MGLTEQLAEVFRVTPVSDISKAEEEAAAVWSDPAAAFGFHPAAQTNVHWDELPDWLCQVSL